MSDIRPDIWSAMLRVPGWTPPSEAELLRAIMEGRAKVVWGQFLRSPMHGFMFVTIGEQSDQDREDAADLMMMWSERQVKRLRAQRAPSPEVQQWENEGGRMTSGTDR